MAYDATVTSPMVAAERISRSFGLYAGKCNIADYDSGTILEITAITKFFVTGGQSGWLHGLVAVTPTGVSDNGHTFSWDYASGAFKCYKPTQIVFSGSSTGVAVTWDSALTAFQAVSKEGTTAAAAAEETGATDCGEIGFIAIGFVR